MLTTALQICVLFFIHLCCALGDGCTKTPAKGPLHKVNRVMQGTPVQKRKLQYHHPALKSVQTARAQLNGSKSHGRGQLWGVVTLPTAPAARL